MRGEGGRRGWGLTRGVAAGLACAVATITGAGGRYPAALAPAPLPGRVYAPYVETWPSPDLPAISARSGARDLTLAFLQTPHRGSCQVSWNGGSGPEAAMSHFAGEAARLAPRGGALIPSFGGYTADTRGTELADSCPSVARIAAGYEAALTVYGATRLDLDVESRSLEDATGIARRNQAIRMVEAWAQDRGRRLQVQYTLPVLPTGLAPSGLAVLASARALGTRVDLVNIMAFDYYDGTTAMGPAAISAATGLVRQLSRWYPRRSARRLWRMVGITLMPGIDDNPTRDEVTTLADVRQVAAFARARGIGALSIWALQRDNGGCPHAPGRDTCSGVRQAPFAFSRLLEAYAS
ncbi:MAG TPA: chitinase [Verrucomicrobiae bacterium]|nr:chitinase [Verrucomicrobiae bacterium]